MTLCVHPNGNGSSKGTHVTVGVCLMKGANDNNLQFPMTGIFTVQVMKWKENNQHFERFIQFDVPVRHRERVVTGERAVSWGNLNFMPHNELTSSNKQYLHKDKMCFKILYEPLPPKPGHYSILFVNYLVVLISHPVWIPYSGLFSRGKFCGYFNKHKKSSNKIENRWKPY